MNSSSKARMNWLDCTKGIGILLVVSGHVLASSDTTLSVSISKFIYLFHMPLFFFAAGSTLKEEGLRSFVTRKSVVLLVPYTVFLVSIGLPALVLSCALGPIPFFGISRCATLPVKLLASGTSIGGIFGVFWFVPCLLLASVAVQAALPFARQMNTVQLLSCGVLFYAAAFAIPLALPVSAAVLSLGIVPMAALYIYLGHAYRQNSAPALIAILIGVGFLLAYFFPANFDMKRGMFGLPIIGLLLSLGLVATVFMLSRQLDRAPVLSKAISFLEGIPLSSCIFTRQYISRFVS